MKTALISYDLENTTPLDNVRVKERLLSFCNVANEHSGVNNEPSFPLWVTLTLPDTTLIAFVDDNETSKALSERVRLEIANLNATAANVFVAFIEPESFYLWNTNSTA